MKFCVLIFILFIHSESIDEPSEIIDECGNDYKCIIKKLNFQIPNQRFYANHMHIAISSIFLYGTDIQTFSISHFPDKTPNNDSLIFNLQINGVNLNATINRLIRANAKITNFTLQLPLHFYRRNDQLIQNLTIIEDSFYAHIENVTIDLTGSFSSIAKKYLQQIYDLVEDLVNNNTNLYSLLNPLLEEKGSQLFEKINGYILSKVNYEEPIEIPINDTKELIPITQSPVIDVSRYVLNDIVSDGSNPLNFNNFVNRYIESSDTIKLSSIGEEFGFAVPLVIKTPTTIDIIVKEASIAGFNTWHDLSFLRPNINSKYILDSHSALGDIDINISAALNFSSGVTQELNLHTKIVNNQLDLGVQIAALKNASVNYTNSQFMNFNCLSKLLNLEESGITKLLLNTTFKKLDFQTNGFLDELINEIVNFIADFFFNNRSDLIPKFVNGFIYESLIMTDLIGLIDDGIEGQNCTISDDFSITDINVKVTYISFCVAAGIGLLFGLLIFIMARLNYDSDNDKSCWKLFWRVDEDASLMMHPAIPVVIRLLIPLFLFSIIALFVSSNTGLGAYFFLKVLINDDQGISFPSLYDFSLMSSVIDLWVEKSYFLSIFICVLSCIWPFIKLVLMLIVWILPAHIMSVRIRSRILNVLDELGKWSLLDSYVVIVMIVAFHLEFEFPIYNKKELHIPTYLNVYVYPGYGFITLIIGTLLSLGMSNAICVINRKVRNYKKVTKTTSNSSADKKCIFKIQHWSLNCLFVFLLVVSLATFSVGLYVKSCTFNFIGYVGWFLNAFHKNPSHSVSVLELGLGISHSVEFPNSFKARLTQLIFFLLTICVPYIHIICLFFLLFLPLNSKSLLSFFYICKFVYSWSCLDVFVVGFFVSFLVITEVYVWDGDCRFLEPIIDKSLVKSDAMCYQASSTVRFGAYFLVTAAVCHTIATIWINIKARRLANEEDTEFDASQTTTKRGDDDDDNDEIKNILLATENI
ncbi:hypothetical protein M9Y10_037525 [Tritrichomonas musculus]|uniref:Uncharacterized protein n=1 Tax=Tritrichomonas musculus TaxID=1915356 RepID=A0ABR2GRS1_9EUKA